MDLSKPQIYIDYPFETGLTLFIEILLLILFFSKKTKRKKRLLILLVFIIPAINLIEYGIPYYNTNFTFGQMNC